jgi:hypothetical protein
VEAKPYARRNNFANSNAMVEDARVTSERQENEPMKPSRGTETIRTTLGDLIEAVTSSALQVSGNTRETYFLSAVVLKKILKKNRLCGTHRIDGEDVLHFCPGWD